MVITFIGMSGSGKTTFSKRLRKKGFIYYGCDDRIEEKLVEELRAHGYSGIEGLAKWMGMPSDPQYADNSERYLVLEHEVMIEILNALREIDTEKQNIVIDTTGSVIYQKIHIIEELQKISTVLLIDTPDNVIDDMLKVFLKSPKPIYWGNNFEKKAGESFQETISRCYPELLRYRRSLYRKHAHKILPYKDAWKKGFTIETFISSL